MRTACAFCILRSAAGSANATVARMRARSRNDNTVVPVQVRLAAERRVVAMFHNTPRSSYHRIRKSSVWTR